MIVTHKAFIKQADMRRMAAVAKEYGISVELEIDGAILRFAPVHCSNGSNPEGFETLEQWRRWRDGQRKTVKKLPDDFAL